MRYSTGCVNDYGSQAGNLAHSIQGGANFRWWYDTAGITNFSRWVNKDVWGEDFMQGTDLAPDGGSDVPEVYMFQGHGICSTSPDDPNTRGGIVLNPTPPHKDFAAFYKDSKFGDGGGNLQFLFLNASCPMPLGTLSESWFPCFQGLHMATGHGGYSGHDEFDDADRAGGFAAYTVGWKGIFSIQLIPTHSVGDAWMICGLHSVQDGCTAVALAAGNDRNDAIDRRDFEKVGDNRPKPVPNWFAWKWVTR
jgi:hypothetical protein